MPINWLECPAEEFCSSVRDGTHDSPKRSDHGRYLVTSRHIVGGRLDLTNAYRISVADYTEINRRSEVNQWDVLLSMIGTVGEPCLVREPPDYAIKNVGLFKTRNETDGKYLYYFLKSRETQSNIRAESRGTTQSYIPLNAMRKLVVRYPEERAVTKTIVHILGTLDDKIELNRQMNETLEAMARALFKSWFIDFDPVKKKAAGIPTGLPPEIDKLFPDRMVESELGEIPEGWNVVGLLDKSEVIGGGTPKTSISEYWNGNIPWFSVVDSPRPSDIYVLSTKKSVSEAGVQHSSTRLLSVGTTIISARGTVGNIALVGREMCMNQSCYGIRWRRGGHDAFVYFTMRFGVDTLRRRTHGAVFDTITQDTLRSLKFVCPEESAINAFEQTVSPILSLVRFNLEEIQSLSALRDTLLPKLISGELEIKDPDKFLERVT